MKREIVAEALGTMLLVAGVVGSGIMAQRLTGDVALQLLCNAIATGTLLTVLILVFAPISGAHFNPAVTLSCALRKQISPGNALLYAASQIAGGIAGTFAAHAMFGMQIIAAGVTARTGANLWIAEAVATFGLLLTIAGCSGRRETAAAVGLYIAAAYWFTASTSFANPAVTIARAFTPSFSGIRPVDVLPFVAVQLGAAMLVTPFLAWLFRRPAAASP
ncbi:MAG TPA: MIP/aquaporin family protein [Rhizomicrobium sp.]|nr:MIP/aquaporin family protein [Rhizomicrobium sp.]